MRDRTAAMWRRARGAFRTLTPAQRENVLAQWNASNWHPPHEALVAHHVEPRDGSGAVGREQEAHHDLDRGGLARSVGTQQANHLALGNRERDPLEGLGLTVGFLKVP